MRWRVYVDLLTPDEAVRLIDLLTLGSGRTAYAVRLARANASLDDVEASLAAACGAFRAAGEWLARGPGLRFVVPPRPDSGAVAPAQPWHAVLDQFPAPERLYLLDTLTAAVTAARQVGQLALADSDVEAVGHYLELAVQALTDVRRLLHTAA